MKRVPKMTTDEAAEKFLDQDLSDLDFSQFKPVQFEFRAKDAQINMRLPAELLLAVRRKAEAEGHALSALHPGGAGTGGDGEEDGLKLGQLIASSDKFTT